MVTLAAAHNGGRSQINMNYLPTSGDYAFINVLKSATTGWIMKSNVSLIPPNQLDANNYPIDLTGTGGGVWCRVFVPAQKQKPGNWKLVWDGGGYTMQVASNGGVTTVLGSLTGGSYEFSISDVPSTYIDVSILGLGSGLTDLKLYHVKDETALNGGNVYTDDFKAVMRTANFGSVRFLNWQDINSNTSTVWAYRMPTSHWSWGAYRFPPELYAGVTSNSGGAYSVAVPGTLKHSSDGTTWVNGQAPKDKDTIIVRFGAAISSGGMTLQVGSGGASSSIAVTDPYCSPLSSAGNNYPLANRLATLIFDATLNLWMKWGGDTALYDVGIDSALPIEMAMQLCNEIGAHPHFNFPPYALDPMTDYVPSMVALVKSLSQPWTVPTFEPPNELWNPLFYCTAYASAKATALGYANGYHAWYGKVASTAGQAVNAVYGGTPGAQTSYRMCCAVQTGTGNTVSACSTSDERMSAASYVNQVAAPQPGYTKSAASGWVTHVTLASYFNAVYNRGDVPAPYEPSLAATLGAVRFSVSSCSGGNLVVNAIDTPGGAVSSGMTMIGLGIPSGVTITGGTYPNFTISDSSFSLASGSTAYAYVTANYGAAQDYVDTAGSVASGNISSSGTLLTVNSSAFSSGPQAFRIGMYPLYGGSYNNTFIVGDHSTDNTLTGTGGAGTYRLNQPLGGGDVSNIAAQGSFLFSIPMVAVIAANWKAWAQGFGVQKMNFYEGGLSQDYTDATSSITCLRYVAKYVSSTIRKASGLGGYTTDMYNALTALGGGGFTAEYPSQYELTGPYPSVYAWPTLEDLYRVPVGPSLDAIAAYNQAVPRYLVNLRLRLHA